MICSHNFVQDFMVREGRDVGPMGHTAFQRSMSDINFLVVPNCSTDLACAAFEKPLIHLYGPRDGDVKRQLYTGGHQLTS